MPSTTATPPPSPTPSSSFFSGYSFNDHYSYTISDKQPPLPETASTGVSNNALITVIVFSITVIVSISLCLLIRALSGRCTRRMQPDEENGASTRILASRRVQPLDEEQHRDPKSPVQKVNDSQLRFSSKSSKPLSGADCPICLSKFEPKDSLRLLPICCHAFHAECVDLWLESNQSCPLCRSAISASETEILQKIASSAPSVPTPARILINQPTQHGSLVRAESENKTDDVVGPNRSWLRDYVETFSSRTSSFSYFTGSSRRGETLPGDGYWDDIEASRAGEEISEMFRWFSGI